MIPIPSTSRRGQANDGRSGRFGARKELPPNLRVPSVAVLAFLVVLSISVGAAMLAFVQDAAPLGGSIVLGGTLLATLALLSIKVADQWEKAVVLRLGAYRGLRGPGPFLVIPFVDTIAYFIDHRIRATDFAAESCLTRDTVPVNVDAIAFWFVWDAEKAALEVESYYQAVVLSAQTALRDTIGKHDLAEMIQSRDELGQSLRETLDKKMHDWGITVQSVEVRDVNIPQDLEDAMSRQAQAERERQARIILGTAETEIAEKFVEAASHYRDCPVALNLRAMNMLYEGIVKRGSLMVVPSGLSDSLNTGALTGLAALGQARLATQPAAPAPVASSDTAGVAG